ncbi:hypothetical protein [Thalassoglobus polymorphus]|uniref:Uncharacterized protein n=1 Tax=Thalassoglobus polymorphus TaxID=2527994 RepID=A0A517QU62_9PLAN|nr:hypothetical protein [Thalassoglobus polymorphus]QDT35172.1 hypothetical protein Mal48_44480 [Thalassoglobus polymorphus]
MIDYQSVVDEIRYAIQSEDCELTDDLRSANAQYVEACRDINKRLRRVEELLNAGLRSEAIQFGEGPPNVIEVVSVLSFPEAEEWSGVVLLYDLPAAEKIKISIVEQLSEAQLIEEPLQNLLARHRRLSLARAPLQMRLDVLRQLRQEDPETYTWDEDVRTFEQARFKEMATVAKEAHQVGDKEQLKQVFDELNSGKWLEPAPKKLIASLRKSLASHSKKAARQEVEELAEQLEQAFSELDIEQAKSLRTRWLQVSREAALPHDAPTFVSVAPVLGWISDEEEREANEKAYELAVSRLEILLNDGGSIEELESLEHEILSLEKAVPDLLANRLENRLETLRMGEVRSHRLKLGGVVAVLVLLTTVVSILGYRQVRSNAVTTLANHVEHLLDEEQYDKAEAALNSRSDVLQWPKLLNLQTRLDQEVESESNRVKQLDRLSQLIEEADSYEAAMQLIEQATPFVKTTDDELEMQRISSEWDNRNRQEMLAKQREVQDAISQVTSQLISAEAELSADPQSESLQKKLTEIGAAFPSILAKSKGLDSSISGQINSLSSRHKHLIDERKKLVELFTKRSNVTTAALITKSPIDVKSDIEDYRQALEQYANVIEDEDSSKLLASVASEAELWSAGLEWSELTRSWSKQWPTSPNEVASRIQSCETFLNDYPTAPDLELLNKYITQLKSIERRVPITGDTSPKLKDKLTKILATPLIADSWILQTKQGKRYYLPEEKKINSGLFRFSHFVGYGADELRECGDVKFSDLKNFSAVRSPCSEVADWAQRELNEVDAANWNEFCKDLADSILNNGQMNAFLKLDLLRRVLEMAAEGDVFLSEALKAHIDILQGAQISPVARWMNPDDLEGKAATSEASQVLEKMSRLKGFDEVWKEAANSQAAMGRQLDSETIMVGWIRASVPQVSMETQWESKGAWDLYVAFTDAEKTSSQWRNIGEVKTGKIELKSSAKSFVVPGRPVFAMPREVASP